MKLLKMLKTLFRKDEPIPIREGIPVLPEDTPTSFISIERGYHMCTWLENWVKYTEGDGDMAFLENGTFNVRVLENLRYQMNELRPNPRPMQHEALEE